MSPPTKKRKRTSIQTLEHDLTTALTTNGSGSLNPLADLLDLLTRTTTNSNEERLKLIYALYRSHVSIIRTGRFVTNGGGEDDNGRRVKVWLWEQMGGFVDILIGYLRGCEKALRVSAIQILMSLQKHLSSSFTQNEDKGQPQFHVSHFRKIVHGLVGGVGVDEDVVGMFCEVWLGVYDDVRWFFLREVGSIISKTPRLSGNVLSFLERLTTFPTEVKELNAWWVEEMGKAPAPSKGKWEKNDDDDDDDGDSDSVDDDWRKFFDEPEEKAKSKSKSKEGRIHTLTIHQSLHSLQSHRAVFTRAWLTLLPQLSIPGDPEGTKRLVLRALNVMHRGVLPHLTRPVLVMDWIGGCVDYGGVAGLLALNGLYVLMKEYNLDYPSFYTRLYAFLDRDLLHLKHRARFFRMTELFLSSTHLPATMVASFVKRLARLSLSAPPAAIVMILPFTYNMLKAHPGLMPMIHRDGEPGDDPYNASEKNPFTTRAIESSLWEIQTHRSHYHSSVATLAKMFSEAFTKVKYGTEDFLDHTYSTLLETEMNRKIRKEPALAVEQDVEERVRRYHLTGEGFFGF